jgi:hypothetical protein
MSKALPVIYLAWHDKTARRLTGQHTGRTDLVLTEHGEAGPIMTADGVAAEKMLMQFAEAGVDVNSLAARPQDEGAKAFVQSWKELLAVIESKCNALKRAA